MTGLKHPELFRQSMLRVRRRIEAGQEGAVYGAKQRVLQDINALLAKPSVWEVRFMFSPSGDLQALSQTNGWAAEFDELADIIERLMEEA